MITIPITLPQAILLTAVLVLGNVLYQRFFHPLRNFPGPFWASLSILWYVRAVRYGISDNYQLELHKKYGRFVRIGPNFLSLSDPKAVEIVYATASGDVYQKDNWYDGFDLHLGARRDLFSERHVQKHAERRRIVAPLYTQGAVLAYEPAMEKVVDRYDQLIEGYARSGKVFDMAGRLRRYANDIIGQIYYGRDEGFTDEEYNSWVELQQTVADFGAAFAYLPTPLKELFMLSQMVTADSRQGMKGFFAVVHNAKKATNDRAKAMEDGKLVRTDDVLSKLIEIVNTKGKEINWTLRDVATEVWNVIWGGSDTTANLMTSMFYLVHKHPAVLAKLRADIDKAFAEGRITYPIKYNDANRELPYLHAIIMESLRYHPPLGIGLPRLVPPRGDNICGQWIPGGTTIVMNPNAVHSNTEVFGPDTHLFKPERWLGDERHAGNLERHLLAFGAGPRRCIGRYIAMTETYKLLPTLLHKYNFEFDTPDREWKIWRGWFQRQENVLMRVTPREHV